MSTTANLETPGGAAAWPAPALPAHWALGRRHLALCAAFCGLFLYLDYLPVVHSGTWLHALQGRWIVANRSLFAADPAQPFTEGMRVTAGSWLSDAILGLVERGCGRGAIFHLIAVSGMLLFAMLAWLYRGQTRGWLLPSAGLGMALALGANPGRLPLPEVFGLLCLTATLGVVRWLAREERLPRDCEASPAPPGPARGWQAWALVGAIQLAWTNLHSSFLIGIAVLGCCAVGRGLQTAWQTRSPIAVLADRSVQRWVLLTEWAALVALANPYGVRLVINACAAVANVQVRSSSDWAPLRLASFSGLAFLGSLGLLAPILRRSRRPIPWAEAILLSVGVLAVAMTSRALPWYAVVYVFVVLPHLAAATARRPAREEARRAGPEVGSAAATRRFGWTLTCAVALWVTFCISPISSAWLGRAACTKRLPGSVLPVAVAERLKQQAESQVVFAPLEWADWLAWDQAPKVAAMMTSNVQWVPRKVWLDYQRVLRAEFNWEQVLERYHVDQVLVQTAQQPELGRQVRLSSRWRVALDADGALLAVRVREGANRQDAHGESGEPAAEGSARGHAPAEISGLAGLALERRRPWITTR